MERVNRQTLRRENLTAAEAKDLTSQQLDVVKGIVQELELRPGDLGLVHARHGKSKDIRFQTITDIFSE